MATERTKKSGAKVWVYIAAIAVAHALLIFLNTVLHIIGQAVESPQILGISKGIHRVLTTPLAPAKFLWRLWPTMPRGFDFALLGVG